MSKKTYRSEISRREFVKQTATGLAGIVGGAWVMTSNCNSPIAPTTEKKQPPKVPVGSSNRDPGSNGHSGNANSLPHRILGKTGLEISMLAFGGGSQFLKNENGAWQTLMQRAIELGVNYFDTAFNYNGSEERYAEILAPIREQVYIASKFDGKNGNLRDVDLMMREFETSLRRLNTNYVDVLLIHDVNDNDNVTQIETGVFKQMLKLKAEGTARFIGFSSMSSAQRAKELIVNLDFDVALLALNATNYGSYATIALPPAREKEMGILAMKVMRDVVGVAATAEELIHYVLDRDGVASAVIAHHGMETLEANAAIISQFKPSSVDDDYGELENRLRPFASPDALCWARPDYVDGSGLV